MAHAGGRPTDYNSETAAVICSQLAEGKSLRTICSAPEMPSMAAIFNWLHRHEEFVEQYTRAKQDAAEAFAEDMLAIADDASEDYVTRFTADGSEYQAVDHDHINRARLRVDTRKWIAAKLKPKKYGDFVESATGGINIQLVVVQAGAPGLDSGKALDITALVKK